MSQISSLERPIQMSVSFLAALVLFVILWAASQIVEQPHLGVLWRHQGEVYYAKRESPLQVGDQVVTIDNLPLSESVFPYYHWRKGDIVRVEIERNGALIAFQLPYVDRAPPAVLLLRLTLLLVALTLWGVSTIIALFSSSRADQSVLFFLWCQVMAISLVLGSVTGSAWTAHLSLVFTWWVVPLAVHFHLLFPLDRMKQKVGKTVSAFYLVAFLGFLRLPIAANVIHIGDALTRFYSLLFYLWVLLGLVVVLLLLARSYKTAPSTAVKRQVGLLAICGFLALAPLLTLSIVPQILLGRALVSPEITFLFFVIIPIGYGYAIAHYEFIKLERTVSRSATVVLVIGLLCSFYFVLTALLHRFFQQSLLDNPLYNLTIIILLVVIYNPLYGRLQKFVDSLLYGGWYDYSSVVGEVTNTLENTTEIEALAETVSASIQKTMRVYWAGLLLPRLGYIQSVARISSQTDGSSIAEWLQPAQMQTIIRCLKQSGRAVTSEEIQKQVGTAELTVLERRLLDYEDLRLWVPIRGRSRSMGVLLLGAKYGGDAFDSADMDILEVVSRQSSMAFQNVQLIAELEEKARENEQYQRQIVWMREEERKGISRELHDQVIQSLVGLRYRVANIQSSLNLPEQNPDNNEKVVQLQSEIGDMIQTARSLCHDLRPPALDLGLVPSIRSLVSSFEIQAGIEVNLIVDGDRTIAVGEDVALCLFRCTSEALSNILKHAAADSVQIRLDIDPSLVRLSIQDNGRGFMLPERLGSLMKENHFGLVSMRERIELEGGTFLLFSAPGQGARLETCIPIFNENVV
jgi:signal transduction histidine kinase